MKQADRRHQRPQTGSFAKTARLRKAAEFNHIFASPQVSADLYFRVLGRAKDYGHARLGLAISRKADPKAVGRNRIKRIARESFRRYFLSAEGEFSGSTQDFVVLARPAARKASNARLFDSLAGHWKRLARKGKKAQSGVRPLPDAQVDTD